jgi:hypothetical protein
MLIAFGFGVELLILGGGAAEYNEPTVSPSGN